MSKIDKSYLDKKDEEIERIFELILSDYILAKELFVKCIDDIRKRFSGLIYNESTLECIEDFIDEKNKEKEQEAKKAFKSAFKK